MAESIKNLSVNLNIHAIEEYLHIAQTQGMHREEALDELILYFMNYSAKNTLLLKSSHKAITDIKEIFNSRDFTTRSNFLTALTTVCYQSVNIRNIRHITAKSYCPTQIVAAFHHELLSMPEHPIIFNAHLKQLAQMPNKDFDVLLFCIKIFVPEIIIVGDFSTNKELFVLTAIVSAPSVPTCLTFRGSKLEKMEDGGWRNRSTFILY